MAEQAAQVVVEFVRVLQEEIEEKAKVIPSPEETTWLRVVPLQAILLPDRKVFCEHFILPVTLQDLPFLNEV